MAHICNSECEYKIRLDETATALLEGSRLLTGSILSGKDEQILECLALFNAAKSQLDEAVHLFKAHLTGWPYLT